MAQNAANIEQEAAEEERWYAEQAAEMPTDDDYTAQLLDAGGYNYVTDDDDDDDDEGPEPPEPDDPDESDDDMTAEALAESDAASAAADGYAAPEPDEPAVLTDASEQPVPQQPEEHEAPSEQVEQEEERQAPPAQQDDPPVALSISAEECERLFKAAEQLAERIDLLMRRQEKLFNDQYVIKDKIDTMLEAEREKTKILVDSAERINRGDKAMQKALEKRTVSVMQNCQRSAEEALNEVSAAVRDNLNALGEESAAQINALQVESTKRVQNMIKATRPQRFASSLKYGAAMTAFALAAMAVAKMLLF